MTSRIPLSPYELSRCARRSLGKESNICWIIQSWKKAVHLTTPWVSKENDRLFYRPHRLGIQRFSLAFLVKKVSKIIKGKIRRSLMVSWPKDDFMRIGYARVSTQGQNLDLRKDTTPRPCIDA
jgi:hypothetical protein